MWMKTHTLTKKADRSGSDLDIPGAEEDDADEAIGEEMKRNNSLAFPIQGGRS